MCGECGCETMGCHAQLHGRRIFTKAEKIKRLEDYAEELKKEIVAVEERIKEMKT
jgi:hypothetical protein